MWGASARAHAHTYFARWCLLARPSPIKAPSSKKTAGFSISFDGAKLASAGCVKVLGVFLDRELTMQQQTSRVAQRCYSSLITISRIRGTLSSKTIVHLVRALVFPHPHVSAWAPPTKQERLRKEKVVNHAARVVTRKWNFDHISEARQGLGWLSFHETIDYRDCIFMHSLLHQENAPAHLKPWVSYRAEISKRSTRATAAGLLHVLRARLERTRMAVPVRSLNDWNALDAETRACKSVQAFKKRVRKSILSRQ